MVRYVLDTDHISLVLRREALVIEISDTTLSDDKGEKRLQYEELGISEYWIVSVKTCDIIAFSISNIGTSQRIQTSQVIPGLQFSRLKTTLQHRRESNQSAAMAWLMTQIQHQPDGQSDVS